jgi:hypothetical protein
VTNSKLCGTIATSYGFKCSSGGIGSKAMDVGCCGAAFGCSNYSTKTVLQLLQYCNTKATNGVIYSGNSSMQKETCKVLNACNQTGEIGSCA